MKKLKKADREECYPRTVSVKDDAGLVVGGR